MLTRRPPMTGANPVVAHHAWRRRRYCTSLLVLTTLLALGVAGTTWLEWVLLDTWAPRLRLALIAMLWLGAVGAWGRGCIAILHRYRAGLPMRDDFPSGQSRGTR